MGQRVDIPGVGIVEFPDTMSNDDISAAIQSDILKTSPTEAAPEPKSTFQKTKEEVGSVARQVIADPILTLGEGLINLEKSAVGIGNVLTGGRAGKQQQETLKQRSHQVLRTRLSVA